MSHYHVGRIGHVKLLGLNASIHNLIFIRIRGISFQLPNLSSILASSYI